MILPFGDAFRRSRPLPFSDIAPIRAELFGLDRLEQHAETLAAAQTISRIRPRKVPPLKARLEDNAAVLLAAYRSSAVEIENRRAIVPAAEWLLDNYHLVEAQIRAIREDLPPGFYRQLPKLADGPFTGYPRVFGLAWAFVAHTDSYLDRETLRRFIAAYQRIQPLEIGELWALAITLRIVLVENLRRLSDQITTGRRMRLEADADADRILEAMERETGSEPSLPPLPTGRLSERYAAQLAKRLRDEDPRTTPALGWLDRTLRQQGSSLEDAVHRVQQRQGASNVTVRNIITSMRLVSDLDWTEMVESVSLVDTRLAEASGFAAMDFPTRNRYRSAVEELARGSHLSEIEIVERVLSDCESAAAQAPADDRERVRDPGYHLLSDGRAALEREIGFRPTYRLRMGGLSRRLGTGGYLAANLLAAAGFVGASVAVTGSFGAPVWLVALFAVALILPSIEAAASLVNRLVSWIIGPSALPALSLADGVPERLRTLVAVPTLMTGEADLVEQIERLEVHYLSGTVGDIVFALLADGIDHGDVDRPEDAALLATARRCIDRLNTRHGPAPAGNRFLFLHRRRHHNAGEDTWMGWERKRGKLHELNRLLRGAKDTSFAGPDGTSPAVPSGVRYVITLDADTRLPRDTIGRLIGKMAHPLNRPIVDPAERRVVRGYGILQPRVTPSLPIGTEGSLFQRIYSAPGGIDPYAAAISDVYQDLFGEGSYTGKGIYDVDVFESALAGRVPDNTMLSHDLFEGTFARAGLVSDIEVVEDFPARYDVAAKRQHRWMRGDWQLLPWILGLVDGAARMPAIGRAKMLDNLRRSMSPPVTLLALGIGWTLPLPAAAVATLVVLATIAVPALLPIVFSLVPSGPGIRIRSHVARIARDVRLAVGRIGLDVVFLPDRAAQSLDAAFRTVLRLVATRRRLLEWTTAASSSAAPRAEFGGFVRRMAPGMLLGLLVAVAATAVAPGSWPLTLAFAAVWLAAPALALMISRPPSLQALATATPDEARELRLIARRTWRYFETFVTPTDSMLPPDNFQETPAPVVAHRTSPTNIGLYLLSAVAARDFGWAGLAETTTRLEATIATMRRMRRFKGHFFNWYETRDLRVLDPSYVSSVDSGNLAGHLIALANACEAWSRAEDAPDTRSGMSDALALAGEALADAGGTPAARAELRGILDELAERLADPLPLEALAPVLGRLIDKANRSVADLDASTVSGETSDVAFWIGALGRLATEDAHDRGASPADRADLAERLTVLGREARRFATAMDFAFLLDRDRTLLSIGHSLADNDLDRNCYDLIASEARLASFFAIAKGDLPTRHWFRLGRSHTRLGHDSALISWSGSMFEYLMPALVMRAPADSLLEHTSRLVVARQQDYARRLGIPWGVSESAFSARDIELTYQYSNFGVPGLGLKRGLSDDIVIAPYATGLAAMVDPSAALANFRRLETLGAKARYGFVEALDFTPARLPAGQAMVLVRNFMAHHQGMTIVAIANALQDGRMRTRFHREPMVQASELLLHERMPDGAPTERSTVDEAAASTVPASADASVLRRHLLPQAGPPVTHILSNGSYSVMLTAAGAGYSRWRDFAITRFREDVTRETGGTRIMLRDTATGGVWSAADRAGPSEADAAAVEFREDHVAFTGRRGALTTTLEVIVSGESDAEVRRVTVANAGRRPHEIELTSYVELALAAPAADAAHPAFSKMFVETEYLPAFGALIATRRPRTPDETPIWAAHFAVVEGEISAEPTHETDRARFHAGARSFEAAATIRSGAPLSGTTGTVLDPIFSIRRRVLVPAGRATKIAVWTLVAPTREALIDLIDTHHERNAFDRAKTLAWTQAQVELRHLGVTPAEAADFQRLAAAVIYADRRFRIAPDALARGLAPQSGLWPLALSGDVPIVVLRIDDAQDIGQVRQLLRAHEYWRSKHLKVDVVILNERTSSYVQDLQSDIEMAIRKSQARPGVGGQPAHPSVTVLRADQMPAEARALLLSVARIVLSARLGSIGDHLERLSPPPPVGSVGRIRLAPPVQPETTNPSATTRDLEFFNGLGGFGADGSEYVTVLGAGQVTPAPWINVIANEGFGFQVSAEGAGYTWAGSSRENQLTQWSNDPVLDPSGEAIVLRDEATGALFSPTAHVVRDGGVYVARHGFGYSRFEHAVEGLALDLTQFMPLDRPAKISWLRIRNTSAAARRLSVTGFAEWVLGTSRGASAPFVTTWIDPGTGAMMARNPWSMAFGDQVAFADLGGRQTAWTGDRTEFLGRGGPTRPASLEGSSRLSDATGAGLDPCSALQTVVDLAPGETVDLAWVIGQAASADAARSLVLDLRAEDPAGLLADVATHWTSILGAVKVRTPDRAMDVMMNGWLLYQTLACRITARSAFYQASGAYGFRDQLQDTMALTLVRPDVTRGHLVRVAARQFPAGDVQHWWLPHTGQGVRTRISDDRVWLGHATAAYVIATGDTAILDEEVPFIDGPDLRPGEHDAFFLPAVTAETATLLEHCARGIDQCIALTGSHGLPLIGTGDWNDGMNRVGAEGRGESVWLGWLLIRTIGMLAPLLEGRDPARAERWRTHADAVTAAIETHAWDGAWYRRATFDDGGWLGAADNEACRIDSIAQSWAVLSGAADPARARTAMASVERHLIRQDDGLALLFTPPFDSGGRDPGYIKGYPPGLRENGGQYSHAAMWAMLAFARLGDGDRAAALFKLLNPINHALTPDAASRYKVEPYVVAADVYSVAPHVGRGGWTWYTGAAGWMYRAGLEGILGILREGDDLVVNPCLPADWDRFEADVQVGTTRYELTVERVQGPAGSGGAAVIPASGVRLPLDGRHHSTRLAISASGDGHGTLV